MFKKFLFLFLFSGILADAALADAALAEPTELSKLNKDIIATIASIKFEHSNNFGKRAKTLPEEIRGNLVTLRRIRQEFFDDYSKTFTPKVVEAYQVKPERVPAMFNQQLVSNQNLTKIVYCIFENEKNELIGCIEIRKDGWCGNLGNWISEKYWGENCNKRGYYQESLKLITDLYFTAFPKAAKITAHVRKWNNRSYFALQKFGFRDFYDLGQNISTKSDSTVRFTRKLFEQKKQVAHA